MAVQSKPVGVRDWFLQKARQPSSRYSVVAILAALLFLRARLRGTKTGKKVVQNRKRSSSLQNDVEALQQITKSRAPLSDEELSAALEELYVENKDGSYDLLIPYHHRISRVNIHETSRKTINEHYPYFARQPPVVEKKPKTGDQTKDVEQLKVEEARALREEGGAAAASAKKVGVNKEFFRQMKAIFKILIPTSSSKEVFIFLLHTGFLVLRTYLSVLVARLDGIIVRDLVSANGKGFLKGLGLWYLLAIPSTYTNSMVSTKDEVPFRI